MAITTLPLISSILVGQLPSSEGSSKKPNGRLPTTVPGTSSKVDRFGLDPRRDNLRKLRNRTFSRSGGSTSTSKGSKSFGKQRQQLIIITRDPNITTDDRKVLQMIRNLTFSNSLSENNKSMVKTAISLGLKPKEDGTFTSDKFPGVIFKLQPQDGSIFVTTPDNKDSGTYIKNKNGYYTLDKKISTPLPGTEALTKLKVYRNLKGTYSIYGDDNEYFLQKDGSVYDPANRKTFKKVDDTWKWVENTNPLPGTFAIAKLGLTPTHDGYWKLRGDPRAYFIDENGVVYTAGGGTKDRVLPGRKFDIENERWIEDKKSINGSAYIIAKYNLKPNADGTYRNDKEPWVVYIPQRDGSMFISEIGYTHINGKNVGYHSLGPGTFHDGKWDLKRRRPLSGGDYIKAFNLTEGSDGWMTSPRFNGKYRKLSGDRLYYINPKNHRHMVFSNGKWKRASIEDFIEVYKLKPTGDPDGSLYEPGYKGKYYKIGGDRLLFINGKGEHWIFGYHSGEKGERSVWNKASNSGRGATGSW